MTQLSPTSQPFISTTSRQSGDVNAASVPERSKQEKPTPSADSLYSLDIATAALLTDLRHNIIGTLGIATLLPLTEADHKSQQGPYFWLS